MSEPTYRQAMAQAWHLVWHNKVLWLLGLCSAVLGQWGLGNFSGQLGIWMRGGEPSSYYFGLGEMMDQWPLGNVASILLSLWLLGLVLALIIAVIFIAVVSRAALLEITAYWFKRKSVLSLKKAWAAGVKNFWPLLTITLLGRLAQAVVLLFTGAAWLGWNLGSGGAPNTLLTIVVCSAALSFSLTLEAWLIYSSGYVVIDGEGLGKALKDGWHLLTRHLLVSLELSLLLVILSVVLVAAVVVGAFITIVPSIVLWLIAGFSGWQALIGIGLVLGLALFIMLIIISGGIFNAFTTSAWMYLFMKMHHQGIFSRVLDMFIRLGRAKRSN